MSKNIKDLLLLASVFVTGASVLVVEIIAIRILSPYYGNTIYTTSSVIGIVLAALSLGYYIGGRMADKYPHHGIFYTIIFISGLLIIFIEVLSYTLLPFLGLLLSIKTGPLVASLFLFFVPSFLLGMLSPFAIKLHKKTINLFDKELGLSLEGSQGKEDKVGSRSGEVFFWSTMGSIMGSILAGFVLIPYFGINSIIVGTGIFLSLWGLCCFLIFEQKVFKEKKAIFMLLLLLYGVFLAWFYFPKKQPGIIYERDGIYERVRISDSQRNGRPTRSLFQDRSYSGAMYLDSNDLVHDYAKYYELYKLVNPEAKKSFVMGGGAYSIPKAYLESSADMQVDVTEIEPELFNLAKKYFNLKENPRLTNYAEDSRHFLTRNDKKYDIIFGDAYYSLFSIPIHLTTREFFNLVKSRLNNNGVFIGNFSGYLSGEGSSLILSEIKTFRKTFSNSYFFAVVSPKTESIQNIIFLGINGQDLVDFDSKTIKNSNNVAIRDLSEKRINLDNFDFSKYQEITDNFSPIEHLVSKVINQWN